MLQKIISGGQTGADQGALRAAKELGLAIGGWMPRGFRTQDGDNPLLAKEFGMLEHSSPAYPPRTLTNVLASDTTLIFGNIYSPGCTLTSSLCKKYGKPVYHVEWRSPAELPPYTKDFAAWLHTSRTFILNVAGNRENTNPGIGEIVRRYLIAVVTELRKEQNQ